MADDYDVRVHGHDVAGRVNKALPFYGRAGGGGNVKGIGAHSFGGNFKREAGSGAWFKKEINNGPSTQGRDLFNGASGNFLQGFSCLQNKTYINRGEVLKT